MWRRREVALEELEQRADDELRDFRNVNGRHHQKHPNMDRQPSSRLRDYLVLSSEMDLDREPQTYVKAMKSRGWQEAIASLIDSIKKNQTWEIVDLHVGKHTITTKWIFKEKKTFLIKN